MAYKTFKDILETVARVILEQNGESMAARLTETLRACPASQREALEMVLTLISQSIDEALASIPRK